jgi:exopolysaccharide production protein ExoQ
MRAAGGPMALLLYLPEIAGFLLFFLLATQVADIGPITAAASLGLIAVLIALKTPVALRALLRWWPLLLVPILAVVSTLWSDFAATSFRYGIQYLITAFAGVLLALLMTPRRFLIMFLVSLFVFCIACILDGRQGWSAEGRVLIGLTGSKNQMGYAAQLLVLSGLGVLLLRDLAKPLRWIAWLSLPLGAYLLLNVDSATALLMAIGGAVALIGLWFMERLAPGGRLAMLICSVVIIGPLLLLIPEALAAWDHFLYDTLNKDPTLTGRTFLWARADDLIAQRPLLGYGYQAIWMGDSTETIALQRMTGITDGRVFHFHHQFRQIGVDTGYVGIACFVGALLAIGFRGLRQILLHPTVPTSFFFIVFLLMTTRAFTDAIIGPFSVHTVLFFATGVYAFWSPAAETNSAAPARAWRRLAVSR